MTIQHKYSRHLHWQAGASLLEVMVAVLIISFGILGLVGLQVKASSISIAAEDRNRASLLANDFISTMQARGEIPSGELLEALEDRAQDMQKGGLPSGEFKTVKISNNLVAVTVQWTPTNRQSSGEGEIAKYTTVAVLPHP